MEDKILLEHNIKSYKDLKTAIKEDGKACVIQPTGTGKMYLAIKWLMENPTEPFVFLAPTNVILNSFLDKLVELFLPQHAKFVEQLPTKEALAYVNKTLGLNLELMTYAKVNMMSDEEMQKMSVKRVVLDEFHHLGSDKWGSSVDRFLKTHSSAEVLGLTATPIRPSDGKDMVEYLFDGKVASEITLRECFINGILKVPTLINGIYSFEEEIVSIENSLKNKNLSTNKMKEVEKKLKQAKALIGQAHHGIRGIFEENLKEYELKNGKLNVKLIVFCNSIEDRHRKMDECKSWFKRGTKVKKYSITSEEDKETVNKVIKNFEEDNAKCVKLIFVVDMLNEGLHINGVDGVVMLRSTESQIVFLQQLGRALSVGKQNKRSPLVFDLSNNIEVLSEDIEEVEKTGLTFKRGIKSKKGALQDTVFNLQSEIVDIIEYLKSVTYDFQDRIAPLVEYYKEHGTIGDIKQLTPKIGYLIRHLRKKYKNNKLDLEEIKILENMGMIWKVEKNDWFTPFYEKLIAYKEKKGSFVGATTDKEIGAIVNKVRSAHKRKGGYRLTQEMIAKLNEIGFPWEVEKVDWFTPFYEKLIAYKENKGSFAGATQDKEIGDKVMTVRQAFKGKNEVKLTSEMIGKLDAIGFPWEAEKVDWFTPFYEKLIAYKEREGSFIGVTTDKEIGRKAKRVRQAYRGKGEYKLDPEMIAKLNEMGFPWEAEKVDWFTSFYEKLTTYKEKKGSFAGVTTDKEIGDKVVRVRQAYRGKGEYKLDPEMIGKLDAIGFPWEAEKIDWFSPFYEKLVAYKEKKGSFMGVTTDKEIGQTAQNVRRAYKGKGSTKLTQEMINKLNEIGFPWEAEKVDWFASFYEKLIAYKEKKGSFVGVTEDKEIGNTVGKVRQAYKGKGEYRLTQEMIDKLNEIGFPWEGRIKKEKEDTLSV